MPRKPAKARGRPEPTPGPAEAAADLTRAIAYARQLLAAAVRAGDQAVIGRREQALELLLRRAESAAFARPVPAPAGRKPRKRRRRDP